MRVKQTYKRGFNAGHTIDGWGSCQWPNHGHHWEAEVAVIGRIELYDLVRAVDSVVNEFDGKNLNEFLPGVTPTPDGIALYIRERLALDWRTLESVSVRMDNIEATVEVEQR